MRESSGKGGHFIEGLMVESRSEMEDRYRHADRTQQTKMKVNINKAL